MLKKPNHQQPIVLIITGLLTLLVAYILGSRALDTGSGWEYLGTLLLVIFAVNRFTYLFRKNK